MKNQPERKKCTRQMKVLHHPYFLWQFLQFLHRQMLKREEESHDTIWVEPPVESLLLMK